MGACNLLWVLDFCDLYYIHLSTQTVYKLLVYKDFLDNTYGGGEFFLTVNPPKPTDHYIAPVFGLTFVEKYFQFDIGFNGVFAQTRYGSVLYMQLGLNYPF